MAAESSPLEGLRALVRDLDTGSRSLLHYPQVPILDDVRREWSELRSELQVRRSLRTEAPADGGPLNSAVLVQRMLDTMQATSPGYLRHFIDYVDTLSWLQALQDGAASGGDAAKPKRTRKPRNAG
ncbi:DUF2894 domain-containing protein [Stenotrophomonas indicatrix]|uniref:DUF2894 domain-containing protein n=1 Tax=Stenotrophomonas indicatrix TaxID=2045451 RepID=UPI00264B50CD|nr:DUF2894 domain-containing protein [Stenotrophomonas indicatrix]MDN8643398.1 DUF2894 domain-containing protein [Stenotrophomonas indicatrix]MDN8654486.1 DUF2894 domain-containing protein [Stenotrophomonas indicatrix]